MTQSRGLGKTLETHLRAHPEVAAKAPDLKIKMSGCPNGCGQHHIAGLGFQGSIRKLGDRVVPQYFVMVGGGVDDQGAKFGRLAAKVPARRITDVVDRLVDLYARTHNDGESATAFFQRVEVGDDQDDARRPREARRRRTRSPTTSSISARRRRSRRK